MKTIVVACAGGIATSGTVASKINMELESRGFDHLAKADAIDIKSLEMYLQGADIYVSITPFSQGEYNIPVVSGIPFLTGVGIDEVMEQIVEKL
jgi:PTS system galactitol-specific IIB component